MSLLPAFEHSLHLTGLSAAAYLESLTEVCRSLSSAMTAQGAFNIMATIIPVLIDCEGHPSPSIQGPRDLNDHCITYAIPDSTRQCFERWALTGSHSVLLDEVVPFQGSFLGTVMNQRALLAIDVMPHQYRDHGSLARAGFKQTCSIPLISNDLLLGVLTINSDQPKVFTPERLNILKTLGMFLETTLERIQIQAQATQVLEEQARTDSLTQLFNRAALQEFLQSAIIPHANQAAPDNGTTQTNQVPDLLQPFALLFIDLDRFKEVNDTLGHTVGDRLLCQVAHRFKASLRDDDVIARVGGDEFVAMIRSEPTSSAYQVAERLSATLEPPIRLGDRCIQLSCSVGMSFFPQDGVTVNELMQKADIALYDAKEQGRGLVRFYNRHLSAEISDRLKIENALRNESLLNQLTVEYQPQWNCQSNQIYGFESLVRWHHPTLGPILSSDFIPIAESLGCITKITDFVLAQSLQLAREIMDQSGLRLRPSVNVSAQEFQNMVHLQQCAEQRLKQFDFPSDLLTIELTETVFLEHSDALLAHFNTLRQQGIRIAIDDFGTGFSCLSYLLNLPLNTLKIDRAFVSDIDIDPKRQGVVRAILSMAESLGMSCIAEGVETQAELEFLRAQGCSLIQGYVFSQALSKQGFMDFIDRFFDL